MWHKRCVDLVTKLERAREIRLVTAHLEKRDLRTLARVERALPHPMPPQIKAFYREVDTLQLGWVHRQNQHGPTSFTPGPLADPLFAMRNECWLDGLVVIPPVDVLFETAWPDEVSCGHDFGAQVLIDASSMYGSVWAARDSADSVVMLANDYNISFDDIVVDFDAHLELLLWGCGARDRNEVYRCVPDAIQGGHDHAHPWRPRQATFAALPAFDFAAYDGDDRGYQAFFRDAAAHLSGA